MKIITISREFGSGGRELGKRLEILSDSSWGQRGTYHLIINTSSWSMKELAQSVADFAENWFKRRA